MRTLSKIFVSAVTGEGRTGRHGRKRISRDRLCRPYLLAHP